MEPLDQELPVAAAPRGAEIAPQAGGSFQREADGSLTQLEGTAPAEPELSPEPRARQ